MGAEISWLLLALPLAFGLGWWASRLDLRQAKRDPRDATAPIFKGLNLLLNEQHDQAIDAFIEAVQHDPDTVELHFALGSLFRRRGETERAVRVHEHLLARSDLPAAERQRAQHALAQDFFKAGLFDRAEAAYRALAGTAYALQAELALLSLYERSRDWARAGEVAQALETRGTGSFASRRAHYLCEQALQARSESAPEQAQQLLAQALTLDPAHARARLLQAQWACEAAQWPQAMQAFAALRIAQPAAWPLAAADYAACAVQAGQVDEAAQLLRESYALAPALATLLALNTLQPEAAAERLAAHLAQHPSLNTARAVLAAPDATLSADIRRAVETAAKPLRRYRCAACGFEAGHYFWQCPGCLSWDSFPPRPVEEL